LCAADLLVALDSMVVTVALPAIQHDFGTGRAELQWVITAYTLSLGAFMLIGGRAGDLYGRRRMLMTGLVLFALASLGAGLAPATGALLVARAVQGIGAALAIPSALALLSARYRQERERARPLPDLHPPRRSARARAAGHRRGGRRLRRGLPRRRRAARAGRAGGRPYARAGAIRAMMRGGCCCSRSRSASPSG
jgi:hypothetical protein